MKSGKPNRKSISKRPSLRNGIIDADGHVRETDEQIMEYMSAGYRSRREAMLYFPLVPHHGWHRSIPANDFRYQDFRVPDWREWAGKLDEGNIELTVLYPTRFMHIGQIGNPRYAVELCRAYNDFLHEQFLTQDRRFRGMALLPLQDVPSAVKELRRAVKSKELWHGGRYLAGGRATSSPRARIVSPDFH
jgi:predicted TIM-barrel fold metal-dependent hydrolase